MFRSQIFIISFFFLTFVQSRASTKKIRYFQNNDNQFLKLRLDTIAALYQKSDGLKIHIISISKDATAAFNFPKGNDAGYLLDSDGVVYIPILGFIKAEGLTRNHQRKRTKEENWSQKLFLNPIVNIRQLNYGETVLEEVARPSVVNVTSERITLLKAYTVALNFNRIFFGTNMKRSG